MRSQQRSALSCLVVVTWRRRLTNRRSLQDHFGLGFPRSSSEHLRAWTTLNRELTQTIRPDNGLTSDIEDAHPRTLWASIRREGNWSNFDYYYHLGYATRQLVANTAGVRVRDLKANITVLAARPDYSEAQAFLRQLAEHVDNAVEQFTRQAQLVGQTIYRDALRNAAYWAQCESVYGSGRSFRRVVSNQTRDKFNEELIVELHRRLNEEIRRGWATLIQGLDAFLEAPAAA